MTLSSEEIALPDARDREVAVGTFDRNLVVTAGAGTGKTTLLVDRLVHLLMRNPDPLKITEIVALTFTNKAADELKLRLRQRLQDFLGAELDRQAANDAEKRTQHDIVNLVALYRLSRDELDSRARDALRNMERSDIGTIHSFAASLLRFYPLEAGVDPQFSEDDGAEFERIFDEEWDLWLDGELALDSLHGSDWRKVLARLKLEQIKALAKSLCAETAELRGGAREARTMPDQLSAWLADLETRASALAARHPEDRMNEKLVRAALTVVSGFKQSGRVADDSDEYALLSEKSISRDLKDWSEADIAEARALVRAARGLINVDGELAERLRRLLVPYAEDFRERFIREGHISFDGLLARARNLVRDQPRVRADLKRRHRTILIDEFQDTDPIQYEILLYLAERQGQAATDWRQVEVAQGKIFVVGDPKQSIYAFRRADIEAYLEVVEKIIKAQNGIECRLTTNFRSNAVILNVVNGAFETLIRAQDSLQAPYIAIHAAPGRTGAASRIPKVMVRKIVSADEEIDAEAARRLEGESLARWLKEQVLGKAAIVNAGGENGYARPKDVAILFRKLTDIHDYLEPLRRQGIRYVVEGERHFYAAKEIIDAVNLLRAVENPHDRLALVGVLRSPLGGLTDQEIYELHRQNLLDYRAGARLEKDFLPTVALLYDTLARLHHETPLMPIGAAVEHVFTALPVELLAASQFHGEQAVANLHKLLQQAELLGREGSMTLKEAVRQLEGRVREVKEEGESVLAEENLDAVRVMSIHKAKGLEFPIVVLAGCQTGTEGRRSSDAEALSDWSTGLTGIRIGPISDPAGLYIAEKTRLRNIEEQKRLLYVAMTRARENLIISCAPSGRRSRGSFLSMLDEVLNQSIANAETRTRVSVGDGVVEIEVVSDALTPPGPAKRKSKRAKEKTDWEPFMDAWARRAVAYQKAQGSAPFLTPTLLKRQEKRSSEAGSKISAHGFRPTPALAVGDLAHRFLQIWDFSADANNLEAELDDFIAGSLPREFESCQREIDRELKDIFRGFFGSKAYAELASAKILGCEVPLLIPWDGKIMEGVIDVIYERRGLLYLADYKTDRIDQSELDRGAERYRQQGEIYTRAAVQSLRRNVAAFKVIFLRLGAAVEVPSRGKQGELFA